MINNNFDQNFINSGDIVYAAPLVEKDQTQYQKCDGSEILPGDSYYDKYILNTSTRIVDDELRRSTSSSDYFQSLQILGVPDIGYCISFTSNNKLYIYITYNDGTSTSKTFNLQYQSTNDQGCECGTYVPNKGCYWVIRSYDSSSYVASITTVFSSDLVEFTTYNSSVNYYNSQNAIGGVCSDGTYIYRPSYNSNQQNYVYLYRSGDNGASWSALNYNMGTYSQSYQWSKGNSVYYNGSVYFCISTEDSSYTSRLIKYDCLSGNFSDKSLSDTRQKRLLATCKNKLYVVQNSGDVYEVDVDNNMNFIYKYNLPKSVSANNNGYSYTFKMYEDTLTNSIVIVYGYYESSSNHIGAFIVNDNTQLWGNTYTSTFNSLISIYNSSDGYYVNGIFQDNKIITASTNNYSSSGTYSRYVPRKVYNMTKALPNTTGVWIKK